MFLDLKHFLLRSAQKCISFLNMDAFVASSNCFTDSPPPNASLFSHMKCILFHSVRNGSNLILLLTNDLFSTLRGAVLSNCVTSADDLTSVRVSFQYLGK